MQSDSEMYGAADTEAQAPAQENALGRKTIAAICLAAALSSAAVVGLRLEITVGDAV